MFWCEASRISGLFSHVGTYRAGRLFPFCNCRWKHQENYFFECSSARPEYDTTTRQDVPAFLCSCAPRIPCFVRSNSSTFGLRRQNKGYKNRLRLLGLWSFPPVGTVGSSDLSRVFFILNLEVSFPVTYDQLPMICMHRTSDYVNVDAAVSQLERTRACILVSQVSVLAV